MRLRVLIADDEPLARERLRQLLLGEPDLDIVGECATGSQTVESIRTHLPDLVLLDVRMPDLNGFEVMRALKMNRPPIVIFVTAHHEFALQAFDASAADYLLKPFELGRFRQAIRRAKEIARGGRDHSLENVPETAARPATKPVERFAIASGGRVIFIRPDEIQWIQSADNYAEIHVGEKTYLLRQTLAALETQLPPTKFVRISRSVVVHVDQIKEFRRKTHGDYLIVLKDNTKLPGTRKYRRELPRLLGTE